MRIGIIGAGRIGATLTRRFRALGHEVTVANSRGPDTLADLAAETGATAATVSEVVRDADVVVVAIPMRSVASLPPGLFDGARNGVAVVDAGNYYPQRDGRIEEIEAGRTSSRWVADQVGRPVVKAFNTIRSDHLMTLGKPSGSAGRIALPIAGDDPAAKDVVLRLIDELGFDGVDAGTLDDSWRQEPGTPVYAADRDAEGTRRALDEETA